ncbi:MAG TPA: sulfite reductase subunit A, partial [Bacteroidota bacterium]|nr:sulfite reductase subunit A [Bacteroidota bacterium]
MQHSNISSHGPLFRLESEDIDQLIACLKSRGYTVIGPTIQDGAILHQEITSASDLPLGMSDEQQPGSYRLKSRNDKAMFGYAVGPQSFKKFLFPPFLRLFSIAKNDGKFEVTRGDQQESASRKKYAFFGIRPCELHAILIQDKVFLSQVFQDGYYKAVRENILMVAVNCGQPASTCFCASLHTGPRAEHGYDLCLTEILKDGEHYFVLEVGTDRGSELLSELPHRQASEDEVREIDHVIDSAAQSIKRDLDTSGLKEVL